MPAYIERNNYRRAFRIWRQAALGVASAVPFLVTEAAGPPMNYDQWTTVVGTGARAGEAVIQDTGTNECATGAFTCTLIAEDDGWRYEIIETSSGEQYTRMLMTETAADGGLGAGNTGGDPSAAIGDGNELAFTTETYTPMLTRSSASGDFVFAPDQTTPGLVAQGIAARQEVQSTATGGDFVSTAEIQRGFARDIISTNDGFSAPTDPLFTTLCGGDVNCAKDLADQGWSVKLTQTLSDATTGIESGFSNITYTELPSFAASAIETNIVRGRLTDVWQDVTDTASGDHQKFDYRSREGRTGYEWFCNAWNPCQPYNVTEGGSITVGGNLLSWGATDQVSTVWLAGDISPIGYLRASTATNTLVDQNFTPSSPSDWPAAADADLNWALAPNVPDPFAASAPRTSSPTFP